MNLGTCLAIPGSSAWYWANTSQPGTVIFPWTDLIERIADDYPGQPLYVHLTLGELDETAYGQSAENTAESVTEVVLAVLESHPDAYVIQSNTHGNCGGAPVETVGFYDLIELPEFLGDEPRYELVMIPLDVDPLAGSVDGCHAGVEGYFNRIEFLFEDSVLLDEGRCE